MSWMMIAAATVFAFLIAMLGLTEWIVRRGRFRKGLQWSDKSPKKPERIFRR